MFGKMRLAITGILCALALVYVTILGLTSTWQYYVLVDECMAQTDQFRGKRLRISGRVAHGSLTITEDRRQARFVLAGEAHAIPVSCTGPLPDNLAERMDVVVEGVLREDGHVNGHKVITRCASKYAPKESGQ